MELLYSDHYKICVKVQPSAVAAAAAAGVFAFPVWSRTLTPEHVCTQLNRRHQTVQVLCAISEQSKVIRTQGCKHSTMGSALFSATTGCALSVCEVGVRGTGSTRRRQLCTDIHSFVDRLIPTAVWSLHAPLILVSCPHRQEVEPSLMWEPEV